MTRGTLRLTAERRGARTVLSELYRTAPFHPGPPSYRGEMAEVILQDVGPGIMPGDELKADVRVADGAGLVVSGQGATRLYPSRNGAAATGQTSLHVASAGTLWWLPGPLIPFHDADYVARTEVALDEGARFACLEVLTPGRSAMGECFAYRRLDLRLRVTVSGRQRLIERAVIEPALRPLAVVGRQGRYPCAGSLVTVGYNLPAALPNRTDVWLGADGGAELAMVRGLASSSEALRETLREVLLAMARSLGHRTGSRESEGKRIYFS